ncbi:MAG: MotA/TolQ/ExbB proton channel family protein [Pirellulales bacterium]|nr:MotA/TolQ/ExbB proton channel family protein [Pirellulales bacterium]
MNRADSRARRAVFSVAVALAAVATVAAVTLVAAGPVCAQETGPQPADLPVADQDAAAAEGLPPVEDAGATGAVEGGETTQAAAPEVIEQINWLETLIRGGWLMLPILAMSLLVVTFAVERLLALRRYKVLPPQLIAALGRLAGQKGGLDPRQAYRLCQQYPSAAANVIKAMLLKVGRPHTEVEHTVAEANDREAARLYANVRWLSLAAGVAPLLGLLGTVYGMILAFFATANLPIGANKAQHLADGIYVALVTTFAGLAVAIPAAVLAHFFEGWIQKLFRELDETLLGLMPQLERFEGRLRISKDQMDSPGTAGDGRLQREPVAGGNEASRPVPAPK